MRRHLLKILPLLFILLLVGACSREVPSTPPVPSTPTIEEVPTFALGQEGRGNGAPSPSADEEPTATTGEPSSGAVSVQEGEIPTLDPSGQSLELWHALEGESASALESLIERFNEQNEFKIRVEAVAVGSLLEVQESVLEAVAREEGPALLLGYADEIAAYGVSGVLLDPSPYLHSTSWGLGEEEQASILPSLRATPPPAGSGARFGFPAALTMDLLLYNVELLEELGFDGPPADWETFRRMACAARDEGVTGYLLTEDSNPFIGMILSRGELADEQQYRLASPAVVESAEFVREMIERDCAVRESGVTLSPALFGSGRVLFTVASASTLPRFQEAVAAGYGGAWNVAAFPAEAGEPSVPLRARHFGIPGTSEQKGLAAWLFIRWFTAPAQQAEWALLSHELPIQAGTMRELAGQQPVDPLFRSALDLLGIGRLEPALPGYSHVRPLIYEVLTEVSRGADVTNSIEDLQEDAMGILDGFPESED